MALTDLQGRFLQTNAAYRDLLGRGAGDQGRGAGSPGSGAGDPAFAAGAFTAAADDLRQHTLLSLVHPGDAFQCRSELEQLRSARCLGFTSEKRYLRPDGKIVWVRDSVALLNSPSGKPTRILFLSVDVSVQKRTEELLLESEKLAIVGRLVSSIAHEINNPLESVINLLYLVRNSDTLEEARLFASDAETEIARVSDITRHTLQFHREPTTSVSTDIVELVQSVLALYRGKLNQAGIRVRFESEDTPQFVCFPGEIRQVIANLIRNSIEAMQDFGELRVRVRPATDWRSGKSGVRITIADNGQGMSLATRERIYDPFFTTKGVKGTGLGLWVTAGILRKHQASMHVRSRQGPGASGTAFTLIFPNDGTEGTSADGSNGKAIAA